MRRTLKKEKDLINEIFRIINQYFPNLINKLGSLTDKRHQSYVRYNMKTIVVTRLLALLSGINTMDGITEKMYDDNTIINISHIVGEQIKDMPHEDTINNVFVNLDEKQLRNIQKYICVSLIRSKMLDKYRYKGYFQILVDATGLHSSRIKYNDKVLEKNKEDKDGNPYIEYSTSVLEAKLIVGPLVISFDTEFIENGDYNEDIKSEDKRKQDCEINAFKRMATRIKTNYPKLKLIITGDALYACEPIINICKDNKWGYILRFKADRIKTVYKEFEELVYKEKQSNEKYQYINDVHAGNKFKFYEMNIVRYYEAKNKRTTEFTYISSFKIDSKNKEQIVELGRKRWKIENEGFNNQKNIEYNITHLCSRNDIGIKSHYYMIQLSDALKQLLKYGSIEVKNIFRKTKEVSDSILETLTHTISDLTNLARLQLRFDD